MSKKQRATLRDVARSAKVSVATVSRVLNNSELVTTATRTKVNDAVMALGFTPSAAARTLNSGRTRTIGVLIPTLDHAIFAKFLNELEDKCSELGFTLVVSITDSNLDTEVQKAATLLNMGVEGLVVSGKAHGSEFDDLIDRFDVPVVITSYFDDSAKYPTIGYDNAAIAQMALEHLHAAGHRNIAVIHGPASSNDRTEARIDGLRSSNLDVTLTFWETGLDIAGGASTTKKLMDGAIGQTAILCLSDVLALGAFFELQRRNLKIPEDMSLMGFDNLEWGSVSTPPLTTIDLPVSRMATEAAVAICRWADHGTAALHTKLHGEIVSRASTISSDDLLDT